jgi:beta-glucosidase
VLTLVRILAAWYKLGLDQGFPERGVGMPAAITDPHEVIEARDKASKPSRFQAAVEGHVLVKNTKNALPLKTPKMLSLYGYNAPAAPVNMHNPIPGVPLFSGWFLGLLALDVPDAEITKVSMDPLHNILPNSARRGHLFATGGSAATAHSYISAPFNEVQQQAMQDDTQLYWDFTSQNPNVNPGSNACLVFINEFATEQQDRPSLADPWSDILVGNVAKKCSNTIVVINNSGIRLVDAWIDHPNVTAVVLAGLPGQESGKALVEILYGKQSPSGRLPYTIAKKDTDYGNVLNPEGNGTNPQGIQSFWTLTQFVLIVEFQPHSPRVCSSTIAIS